MNSAVIAHAMDHVKHGGQMKQKLVDTYRVIKTLRSLIHKAELGTLTSEEKTKIHECDIEEEKLKLFILQTCNKSVE